MRFADYLSRHTNSPPTGKNMNENHVISTLTAVQYRLHTTHNKLTNHKARNTNTLNDVKIRSSWNDRKKNRFSLFVIYTFPDSRSLVCIDSSDN